jgi:hypothetical protein
MATGGNQPAPAVKALTCPSCGGGVKLRAAGYSVTVACEYCSSILDVSNPEVRLITEYHQALEDLEIKLGTRGTLKGVEWEVVGYLRRSEGGAYPWEEYLLFNPYHGYRWLVTNGRGWSFGEMLTRTPTSARFGRGDLELDGEAYKGFFRNGEAQVDYVLGEFYWRVAVGETVATDDFVRPGWMLSREANGQEVSWTLLELLDRREIRDAFGVEPPRHPWPPLPHQPSPYGPILRTSLKVALAAIAFLILVSVLFSGGSTLLQRSLTVPVDGQTHSVTLGPIVASRPYQLIAVDAVAPDIENQWVDLDYSLVNRRTQASYDAYGLAEHYSGRDSDGPWTEGSRSKTVKIAGVPAGTYDLVLDFSGNSWRQGGSSYSVPDQPSWGASPPTGQVLHLTVRSGIIFPSNLLAALIALLLPLVLVLWRHVKFEQARQGESDQGLTGLAAALSSSDDDDEDDD